MMLFCIWCVWRYSKSKNVSQKGRPQWGQGAKLGIKKSSRNGLFIGTLLNLEPTTISYLSLIPLCTFLTV